MRLLLKTCASLAGLSLQACLCALSLLISATPTHADSSSRRLASYYERHMALEGDVAYAWIGRREPRRQLAGVAQVGVSQDAFFALLNDGTLWAWGQGFSIEPVKLWEQVSDVSAGDTATIARTRNGILWQCDAGLAQPPRRLTLPC